MKLELYYKILLHMLKINLDKASRSLGLTMENSSVLALFFW